VRGAVAGALKKKLVHRLIQVIQRGSWRGYHVRVCAGPSGSPHIAPPRIEGLLHRATVTLDDLNEPVH
jgi:hypothetical protein